MARRSESLFRVLRRLGLSSVVQKKPAYQPKPYQQMTYPGQRVHIDVDVDTSVELKAERDSMMTDLGYDVDSFAYYYDTDINDVVSQDDFCYMWYSLNLITGDAIPGFYISEDGNTIVAVKYDVEKIFTIIFSNNLRMVLESL